MTICKTMEVIVRPRRDDHAEILFTPYQGGDVMREKDGSILRFGIPLDRNDQELAELVRNFARWVADLAAAEVAAQREAIHKAAAPK